MNEQMERIAAASSALCNTAAVKKNKTAAEAEEASRAALNSRIARFCIQ